MALLISAELTTLYTSVKLLSSIRAAVGAEGFWSKGQKGAFNYLQKYAASGKEEDYQTYLYYLQAPLGDHKLRMEMMSGRLNMDTMRQGLIQGKNHIDDVDGIINLLVNFQDNKYIVRGIAVWTKADLTIAQMMKDAEEIHRVISTEGIAARYKVEEKIQGIAALDPELTAEEDEFSFAFQEGARWLEGIVLKVLFLIALTVEMTGILLSIYISRNLSKDVKEIIRVSEKVSKGDLTDRAQVNSQDEIGKLAISFNEMIASLEANIKEREKVEKLIIEESEKLIRSNKELEQFAYISSHDLQEPLRTVVNYTALINRKYKGQLDANIDEYLTYIVSATERMQMLIKGLLEYSKIGKERALEDVNGNALLQNVLNDLSVAINDSNAKLEMSELPEVKGYSELIYVFQNLISNAIKFRKKEEQLRITVKVEDKAKYWLFSVADNGIGIEEQYYDKIFAIFQRLHPQNEYEGTGIGLAHTKKIVELHGGKIWVQSKIGKGSTFYFTIPKFA